MGGTFNELCSADLPADQAMTISVVLRNKLISKVTGEDTGIWRQVDVEAKKIFKQAIFEKSCDGSDLKKQKALCVTLGMIGKLELLDGTWTDCLEQFCTLAVTKDNKSL